ncbi:MAG: protein-export chaperone SecB [Deltaproteobacteria bacterium]|jgi:hypothetical protein|nr:protein-export chaperone SecB [Deltaproteobacteria bacterium]
MTEPVPFEMTKLQLAKSHFALNDNWEGPTEGRVAVASMTIMSNGAFSPDGETASYSMSFKTDKVAFLPFTLEVEYGAQFKMSSPVPIGDWEYYVHRAFPLLVFPFMREYVAETTRRGGFPPLVINMSVSPGPRDGPSGGQGNLVPVLKWIH